MASRTALVRGARDRKTRHEGQSTPTAALKTDRFVMCIENTGNEASLEIGKVYRAVRTEKASRDGGLIRVIDESGEDYLFSSHWFVEVKLPRAGREALLQAR